MKWNSKPFKGFVSKIIGKSAVAKEVKKWTKVELAKKGEAETKKKEAKANKNEKTPKKRQQRTRNDAERKKRKTYKCDGCKEICSFKNGLEYHVNKNVCVLRSKKAALKIATKT